MKTGPNKSLERTRAGHVNWQFGRAGPPASLSSAVRGLRIASRVFNRGELGLLSWRRVQSRLRRRRGVSGRLLVHDWRSLGEVRVVERGTVRLLEEDALGDIGLESLRVGGRSSRTKGSR